MAMYNSSTASHDDESDITIINPSIIHENNDEYVPIIIRLKQANNSSENRQETQSQVDENIVRQPPSSDVRQDYIFIDHNPVEYTKQLEKIVKLYVEDLKHGSNSQIDCDKQLVVRLIDHMRGQYSNNQNKIIELDAIQQQIGALHDKRHVDQQEKFQQLITENSRLNEKLFQQNAQILTSTNNGENNSVLNIAAQQHSFNDSEQWTEIDDDTRRLHEIIQSQQNRIDQISELLLQADSVSSNPNGNDGSENTVSKTKPHTFINSLLKKIKDITEPTETSTIGALGIATLENHSPGASPTQSISTLTSILMEPLSLNRGEQSNNPQEQHNKDEELIRQESIHPEPIRQEPPAPIELPVVPIAIVPARERSNCPVCNHEFSSTLKDEEMYDHIEQCLFPKPARVEHTHYDCPYCNQKFLLADEALYLQHLSDCVNTDH